MEATTGTYVIVGGVTGQGIKRMINDFKEVYGFYSTRGLS